jgi:hypothetical protein
MFINYDCLLEGFGINPVYPLFSFHRLNSSTKDLGNPEAAGEID